MKINQHTTLVLLIFLLANSLASGQNELSNLINRFTSSESDSIRFTILEDIDPLLDALEKDSAVLVWTTLIDYCRENDMYKELGLCYFNLAFKLNYEGDYIESYEYFNKSRENYEEVGYYFGIARVHNGLGILFKNLNKFETSFRHYKISSKMFHDLDSIRQEGHSYLNIGGMMEKQDSLNLSLSFLHKSKEILEKYNDPAIVSCYINMGNAFSKKENSDSAFYYFNGSYRLAQQIGTTRDKFNSGFHLAEHYFRHEKPDLAEPYLYEAQKIAKNPEYSKSIPVYDRAKFFKFLSEFYSEKEDSASAYKYLLQSVNYEAQNKSEESSLIISRHEFDDLERILETKRKRREFIIAVTLFVLLFTLLLALSLLRSYQHKKKANQLLTEMDELKTRLYSNITHELRTPLTLILGPLEQMLSSDNNKTPTKKQFKMMRNNAKYLLKLINQMLEVSRIEAKNIKLELVEDDINKFLRKSFTSFASLAEHKSITYQHSLLKGKNIRIFDQDKLEKIINNLISNAIKYTPKKGKVSCVAGFMGSETLQLIVEDSGPGIPRNEIDRIFDRFHRAEGSNASDTVGTGIGLALIKELVDLMHGTIEVESQSGEGSTFTVTIPLGLGHLDTSEYNLIKKHVSGEKPEQAKEDTPETKNDCTPPGNEIENAETRPHILIAEDHPEIREYISDSLISDYQVEQAENGKIALQKAQQNIPDLILTDVAMPEMDGVTLCEKIKTDEKTSHIPVIMLTGKSGIKDRLKGLETGADAYLTKPFNIKELKLRIHNLIEQRKKLRKQFTNNIKLEPKDIAVTSADEKFITRAMEVIEKNMGNPEFDVKEFQDEMYMSRMQLFRKIKALTNQTPGEFIRTIRLKRASRLIEQEFGNIAQIAFEVGFNNPSYFSKCFKELFGVLPSEYKKN